MHTTPTQNDPSPTFPIARADLEEEIRQMRASPKSGGHLGKTFLRGKDMRVVLMVLDRGARIPEHRANGSLTIQTLDGRVIVSVYESSFDLASGQLLAIEHDAPHALVAIEDSAVLLTISWHGHR
jgi:quercetin dioxygenase-like cupin family protein